MLADNAKHNQEGRVEEHGAFRHRITSLCPVGALAMMFFAYFHVQQKSPPDFAPDFSDERFGEYGRRDWHSYRIFWASDITKEMSYDSKPFYHFRLLTH